MNSLVKATEQELRDEAFRISNLETFYDIVSPDMYVDELGLMEFVTLSDFIKNKEFYTVAQLKYVIDTAITMATE